MHAQIDADFGNHYSLREFRTAPMEPPPMPLQYDKQLYGGFWLRAGASVVDSVVLLIPTLVVSFLYRSTSTATSELEKALLGWVDFGSSVAIWWVYTAALLSSSWQATVGKKVCRLRVVDYGGRPITFGRATRRYFASFVSLLVLGLGYLMVVWNPRRQALHDCLANTLVVKVQG